MKLVVFADGNLANLLTKSINENNAFELVGTTYRLTELLAIINKHQKLIILFDARSGLNAGVVSAVKSKGMRIISLCETIKDGFVFLNEGAHDMCVLPKTIDIADQRSFTQTLSAKIKLLYKEYDVNTRSLKIDNSARVNKVIAIGSSTGGTECILQILKNLPSDVPPILIVQHMPTVFTKLYAKRLNSQCPMSVWEAQDGDELKVGLALIAPGDQQMRITTRGGRYVVSCTKEAPVSGHIPSVDALFHSVATVMRRNAVGVILTGMGKDGAKGLVEMKQNGAFTIGQDKKSSVVYGMPQSAFDLGGVCVQGSPDTIPKLIMENI